MPCRAHPACSRQPRVALRLLPRLQALPAWGARTGGSLGVLRCQSRHQPAPGAGGWLQAARSHSPPKTPSSSSTISQA